MKTAKIKCPKCGKESFVVPEDLDKIDLTYHCDQCGDNFEVSFFDHCPKCKVNVGFLEGNTFKKDMYSVGKDMLASVMNPISTIDTFGGFIKNAVIGSIDEANGDGVCPTCNTRYIRCHSCHELFSIDSDAVYKDKFTCPNCGKTQQPGHVKEGCERLYSRAFLSSHSGTNQQNIQLLNPHKQQRDSKTQNTTRISRKEAIKIISFIMHLPVECIDEAMSVNCGRSELKRFKKNGYDIPENVMYQCRTYHDLADAIIDSVERRKKKNFQVSVKNNPYKNDTSGQSMLYIKRTEQEYLDNLKEFLEDDAEITPRERKMLDKIRLSLGISEERAQELEASLKPQLTDDEQDYLDMYREYKEKGDITEKERRRLDKFASALGISEGRTKEIEQI